MKNNPEDLFVIGDIHGMSDELELLLANWQPNQERLVFIGDYIDRGYNSLAVLNRVWQLQEEKNALCLRGNHESMLLNFLRSPHNFFNHYIMNGGVSTICQLLNIPEEKVVKSQARRLARQIKQTYPELESWLESLPYYFEYGEFIIVHAGVDLSLENWKNTSDHEFLWIRDRFHQTKNSTGKQIIFGHTPTMVLHQNYYNSSIWRKDMKWGIDGGCVFGGELHAMKVSKTAVVQMYSVPVLEGE
ncbi:metallophosphoesterase family protein [Facklamia sp. 7083-14-GEN3]|uniref:metallophosphoesterase family protein n=1 Tax=Facklamia sp. 7083-14-GEN3 TaxID=2973478 RepID=UPI00215CFEFB|nr:metallophosphoesterase family protein [Facklamia sp. 7083-14-GEN3]MCR8969521.1 serine/threonine protein phosphatase [Facklamia sp. 7083-14-GEN3]